MLLRRKTTHAHMQPHTHKQNTCVKPVVLTGRKIQLADDTCIERFNQYVVCCKTHFQAMFELDTGVSNEWTLIISSLGHGMHRPQLFVLSPMREGHSGFYNLFIVYLGRHSCHI